MKILPVQNKMEMCLCSRCAGVFYRSKNYYIERTDPFQVIHEPCQICLYPYGYDFQIDVRFYKESQIDTFEKSTPRKVESVREGRKAK